MAVAVMTVENKHLIELLSGNKPYVMQKFTEYFETQYPGQVNIALWGNGFRLRVGYNDLLIENGRVTSTDLDDDDPLFKEAFDFLNVVGDSLFADEVAAVLETGGTITDRMPAVVEYLGEEMLATILSLNVGYLKARVMVLPKGQLQVFVDNGTLIESKSLIEAMAETLQAAGVNAQVSGKIESHRDQIQHAHVMNKQAQIQ